MPIAFAVLSVLAWWTLQPLELARFAAFTLVLISAGSFGEWIIELGGEDPFSVLHALPVGVSAVWGARMASAVVVSVVLVVAHGFAGRALPPPALQLFLIWLGAASLLIQTLAAGYGVTLSPRADVAQRLFMLALGVAMASSLMIPLLGWAVLLAVVLHSLRRLPSWARIEEDR